MAPIASRLSDLLLDALLTTARISDVTEIAPRFVKLRLVDERFRRAQWTPGDKLQLRPQRGSMQMRAYTPMNWDRDEGTTELIAFKHGDGPAIRWFDDATTGADCEVFGPNRSVDLSDTAPTTLFIGDETSVGLAHALHNINPTVRYLYEATDPDALTTVLTTLGLTANAEIIAKTDSRDALLQLIRDSAESYTDPCDLVVSGDAATVNAVRRDVRRWIHLTSRIKARAYWAHGRAGLS